MHFGVFYQKGAAFLDSPLIRAQANQRDVLTGVGTEPALPPARISPRSLMRCHWSGRSQHTDQRSAGGSGPGFQGPAPKGRSAGSSPAPTQNYPPATSGNSLPRGSCG